MKHSAKYRVLAYWHDIITRADMANTTILTNAQPVTLDDFKAGSIATDSAQNFMRNHQTKKQSATLMHADKGMPVLLCLRPIKRQQTQHLYALLYMPAILYGDGTFAPPDNPRDLPWMARRFLEPLSNNDRLVTGTLHDFDTAIHDFQMQSGLGWTDYLTQSLALFERVSGYHLDDFRTDAQFIFEDENVIALQPYQKVAKAGEAIQSLYADILDHAYDVPLLERLILGTKKTTELRAATLGKHHTLHTGQMGNQSGLNESQRQAVLTTLSAGPGSITAVNGPPGTGKTTLLKSVIASLWVAAALKGGHTPPPLILGASTNNQAVTNILDGFSKADEIDALWSKRWLPAPVEHYGLCFPSGHKAYLADTYQCVTKKKNYKDTQSPYLTWPALIETAAFVQEADILYQKNATAFLKPFFKLTLAKTVNKLHAKLVNEHKTYRTQLKRSHDVQQIDTTTRYKLFHLAARYWEGRWLMEMKRLLDAKQPLSSHSHSATVARLQRWAMLCPCFVSTMHTAPKVFSYYHNNKTHRLLNMFDLLIVDEAGQIPPEIGAATFALAKKALVVGDVHQIEPVASLGEQQDRVEAERLTIPFDQIKASHLASSTGNIMALANRATSAIEPHKKQKGVLLTEHWRCQDELIAYCNKLVYDGQLQPKIGNHPNGVTPIWGYAHTINIPQAVGSSYSNEREAFIIAKWLAENKSSLLSGRYAGRPLSDVVAVITPYSAQKKTLEKALAEALEGDFADMTVGTVHALQGAEKPIILFSPTITYKNQRVPFFDRTSNMLNVAVSRAKDSFLVFGDMRLFNEQEPGTPSGLLGTFLKDKPDNEITDIEGFEFKDTLDLVANENRFETHEQHEDLFIQALEKARSRVLIASPYLSIHRIDSRLEQALVSAIARHVKVAVVYNEDLNLNYGRLRDSFLAARDRLHVIGCIMKAHPGFHNKTLAVDDYDLIDGSYNWLSAVTNPESPYHYREISQRYSGDGIHDVIEREWQDYGLT